ncbi:MAG: nascent polypeptide-associated complex protein [Thermoplasmatota archaeon]
MNPRKLNAMMKQLGIDVKEIPDVEEVIVRTKTKEYVLTNAEASIMTAQGQKTWQITGDVKERARAAGASPGAPAAAATGGTARPAAAPAPAPAVTFTEADVDLVASQANVPKDRARKALEGAKGEPAEAIIRIMEGKA